jgi:hypothetical protein
MVAVSPRVPYPRSFPTDRPYLVVVPKPSRRRLDPAVFGRRRLLVAGLILLLVAAALVLVQSARAGAGGGPLATTGAAGSPRPISEQMWVVRPGDTLWSIAAAVDPGGDERPLVDRLAAEVGGATLYPGETIPLPAGLRP